MSKLHLINEITTTFKMAAIEYDPVKLSHYLDDLLSNYKIETKDIEMQRDDNEDYIHMFISALKVENYSRHTLNGYRYTLTNFANHIDKSILKANTSDVRQYLALNTDLKQSTIVTKLDILSSFFGWLVREEELLKNPCDKIKRPKLPKKVREGLTIIELEKVRAACVDIKVNRPRDRRKRVTTKVTEDIRKRALVEVLYSTACRLDEIHKLNIADVDWSNGAIIVCGKGNKERRVYLSEKAKFYLMKYLESRDDECPALFATVRNPIKRLAHGGIQHQIKIIAKSAGINRPLHPHIFRHTFAQMSLNAGMPMEDLQAYLGHEKADTTMRYAAVSEERKRSAFNKFHQQ